MQKSRFFALLLTGFGSVVATASTLASDLPVTVTAVSASYPVAVNTNATTTVTYTLKDNINNPKNTNLKIYPQLVTTGNPRTTTTAGSIAETGGTCSSGVTYNNTCTIRLTYAAPASVPASNPATASILFGYGGRNNIPVQIATFSITSVPSVTISANVANILFSFNDANAGGTIGTGRSVITITNNSSTTAATNVAAVTSLPSGITESANTCGSSLAASSSCMLTFQTGATPDSTQTVSIAGGNTNTLALPIAPLSIRIYSPPVNPVPSNASLMLVNTCTVGELLAITNNSASAVSSLTFDTSAFSGSTADISNCPVSSLLSGKTCVVGIVANTAAVNTSGANILMGWGGASAQAAIFTGVEATGATLPTLSTPTTPFTVYGGYVYQEDSTCNLVKVAALQDQYTNGNGGDPNPAAGSVAWTASGFTSTTVPNPATGSGEGAKNTGLTGGQINTTAVIYQAGTPLTSYASGLCSQYSESSGGINYVGWYLPWDNTDSSGSTTTELAAMYTNLKLGQGAGTNNFANQFYWSSSENLSFNARVRFFDSGDPYPFVKSNTPDYVRCSRALTY